MKGWFSQEQKYRNLETGTIQGNEDVLNHHLKNTYFDLCKQLSSAFFSKHHRTFFYKCSVSSFSLAFIELSWSLPAQRSPLQDSSEVSPGQ